ncbi:hypothetical protein V6N13_042685 [Hibiscus sabdariffa]
MKACKDGFKAGCRPIICLDGCHLKGYHGGPLLTAVGIDTNDCIYPITFAIVESKCHSSWCWCWSTHAGGNIYQVACGAHNPYGVNLEAHTCSCMKWDLTGIPCSHAISVILMREQRPESYVDDCYKTKTQQAIYSHMIYPVKRRFCGTTKEGATTTTAPTQEAPQVQQPPAIQVVRWMIYNQESSISHCTLNVATSTKNDQ